MISAILPHMFPIEPNTADFDVRCVCPQKDRDSPLPTEGQIVCTRGRMLGLFDSVEKSPVVLKSSYDSLFVPSHSK